MMYDDRRRLTTVHIRCGARVRARARSPAPPQERELAAARAEAKRLERSLEEERARVEQQRRDAERRQEGVIGDLEGRVKRTLQAKDPGGRARARSLSARSPTSRRPRTPAGSWARGSLGR